MKVVLVAGQERQQAQSETCRRRLESLLKGDSSRINRALADAVDRHATKDPGVRSTLKRASVVCHPESEPQKKIALDTEQDLTPHPSVSYGGSSASGAQPSVTTSTDQNTGMSDVTREVRTGPAQDVTRTRREDHIGGDVAMGRDSADENSAGHPSPSGSDGRRRITTKREPREVRHDQSSSTEQHVPRMISGRTTPQERAVAVTSQEALDGYRESTMTIAKVDNKTLNWVSISSDEMRHMIGSSEPDVITGSGKDQNRGCEKEGQGSHGIPVARSLLRA